jgi:hypothetical protein
MKLVWLGCALAGLLVASAPDEQINVNTRYTVESVELAGDQPADISTGLRGELTRMVGEKLNPAALDDLALRIRRELHVRAVSHRLVRGNTPEHVRVVFVVRGRPAKFEASVPKLMYLSTLGFTGAVQGTATIGTQAITMGVLSDGEELTERFSGIMARYDNARLGSDRVRFRLLFESYHEQWNRATVEAGSGFDLYRARTNIEPVATIMVAGPLSLSLGASFERLQSQFPAARPESANSMVTTLRYHRRPEGSGAYQQAWDAGYSLRAATNLLGSSYGYARHQGEAHYKVTLGGGEIHEDLTAGMITGRAPLFERFVLGNGTLLRGWDKYDLDPVGGSRMVDNSVDYRYRLLDVFYESGAVWDQGESAVIRHAMGLGIRRNGLCVAVAFPLTGGHYEPIFMVGMNLN